MRVRRILLDSNDDELLTLNIITVLNSRTENCEACVAQILPTLRKADVFDSSPLLI